MGTDSSSAPPLNMGQVWQRQGVSVPALRWLLRDAGGSAPKQRQGRAGPGRTGQDPVPTGSLLGRCLWSEQGGAVELPGSGQTQRRCQGEPWGAPPRRAKSTCEPPPCRHQDAEQSPAVPCRAGLGSIRSCLIPTINTS